VTPKGEDTLMRVWNAWHAVLHRATQRWSDQEREVFGTLLDDLARSVGRYAAGEAAEQVAASE
jgi:hypothetical protein